MTISIPQDHPYWHARAVVEENLENVKAIVLSYYEYVPQSLVDTRIVFSIPALDFLESTNVVDVIKNCPHGYELAIHSKLKMTNGPDLHIPMVDMSTGSAAQLSKLKPILDKDFEKFSWYKSGRSYHGYGSVLINHVDWIALMGKLLLANQIGMPPTVDPRWVGHRLIAGYSALRWTKNTPHYIDTPKKLVAI